MWQFNCKEGCQEGNGFRVKHEHSYTWVKHEPMDFGRDIDGNKQPQEDEDDRE